MIKEVREDFSKKVTWCSQAKEVKEGLQAERTKYAKVRKWDHCMFVELNNAWQGTYSVREEVICKEVESTGLGDWLEDKMQGILAWEIKCLKVSFTEMGNMGGRAEGRPDEFNYELTEVELPMCCTNAGVKWPAEYTGEKFRKNTQARNIDLGILNHSLSLNKRAQGECLTWEGGSGKSQEEYQLKRQAEEERLEREKESQRVY